MDVFWLFQTIVATAPKPDGGSTKRNQDTRSGGPKTRSQAPGQRQTPMAAGGLVEAVRHPSTKFLGIPDSEGWNSWHSRNTHWLHAMS